VTSIEPRVLLPPLLAAVKAESSGGRKGSVASGLVLLVRAAASVTTRLNSTALREALPALQSTLLSALDARWARAPPAAVAANAATAASRRALDSYAIDASAIETEALAWISALAVRLPERAGIALVAALSGWASDDPSDADPTDVDDNESAESWAKVASRNPSLWAYARLARRITLARVTEALCDVAGAVVAPLLAPMVSELSNDVCAAASAIAPAETRGFTPTERATLAKGDGAGRAALLPAAESASPPKRKRVTFEPEAADGEASDAALSAANESDDDIIAKPANASNKKALEAAAADAAATLPTAVALRACRGLERLWAPAVAHARNAPFSPFPYVSTTPRGLLCVAAGALRALAAADAHADDATSLFFRKAASTGTGAAAARERCGVATRALCALLSIPESSSNASSNGLPTVVITYALPLISALVRALRSDVGWKPLHHALLGLARHERASARLGAIATLAMLHEQAGADALTLLPEALPVLAETAHDTDARVEAATHAFVDALQAASGEDLGSFLV
jgi:hypothetical protein